MAENTTEENPTAEEHFVDKYQNELITRVTNPALILNALLSRNVISKETYDEIMPIPESVQKMCALLFGPLQSSGIEGKKIFFSILETYEPHLMAYLRIKERENTTPEATETTEMLTEILNKLSPEEHDEFKFLIELEKDFGLGSMHQLTSTQELVELMVKKNRRGCVDVTRKILKKMHWTDLTKSSEISSQTKGKHHLHKQQPALIQRVEMMVSDIELLLETLADLNVKELRDFNQVLQSQIQCLRPHSNIPWSLFMMADLQDTVFLMVPTTGQGSLEMAKKVLKKINRTDLVQRLFDRSSGPSKKHPGDEHLSALIHNVATMVAVKEVVLETLTLLKDGDLERFKWFLQLTCFHKGFPYILWRRLERADLVDAMVEMCGLHSVEVTRDNLRRMNRTDLVQRLLEISSGLKASGSSAEVPGVNTTEGEKDERCSALIQKKEKMVSISELLLESLSDFNDGELRDFKKIFLRQIHHSRRHSDIPWILLRMADLQETVFLMVQTVGEKSVERTAHILENMKRTDLVRRLFDSSSGTTKKVSADEHCSALIQKVATVAAVKHLLVENLDDLSVKELQRFKEVLQLIPSPWGTSVSSWMLSSSDNRTDLVDVIMQTYSQQSVEVTKKVFMKINRTDLVQRLSETSSGPKEKHGGDEYCTALFERVAAKDAVKHVLLETLKSLSHKDFNKFKWLLQFTYFQRGLPQIPQRQLVRADRAEMVDLMVERLGQQSVEVIREVLTDMNRTDLLQSLSESSLQLRVKHLTSLLQKDLNMTSVKEKLLTTLEDLNYGEFKEFKSVLQQSETTIDLLIKHKHPMTMVQRVDVVELMVQTYSERSVEVTREILKKMNRSDLVLMLSETSSGSTGDSRSLEVEGCGSTTQESSYWTKLEPEVNSTEADEVSTYSLQSEAGSFECSVSALRWVCKEKVSLQYQFNSWEDHMERMESRQYMAAGPLMNITVNTGRLDEVYLPHWICIGDDPTVTDNFAVLHIDECGDVVEKVSEVTPSHVKLSEPVFSPRAVLVKVGLPVKTRCYVLIYYKPNLPVLKLHVYVIPRDPALQKTVDQKEISHRYETIIKSDPDKSLKMKQGFTLTADIKTAKIQPEELTLRHESDPNFFEVFIKNPDRDFYLTLSQFSTNEQVWRCEIQKDDYPSSGNLEAAGPSPGAAGGDTVAEGGFSDEHFVDKHQLELKNKVTNVRPILDELLVKEVISQQRYDEIRKLSSCYDQITELYSTSLRASDKCKDIFYEILTRREKYLIEDLNRKK